MVFREGEERGVDEGVGEEGHGWLCELSEICIQVRKRKMLEPLKKVVTLLEPPCGCLMVGYPLG